MLVAKRIRRPVRVSSIGLIAAAILCSAMASCSSSHRATRRTETNLDPGWPKGNKFFHQASYSRIKVPLPEVSEAELVNDDELCLSCHEAYTKAFEHNVHRGDGCESCHGPASRHMKTRGQEPDSILSFKTLLPAEKSELCLKCHEEDQCAPGAQWRCSKHAHCNIACTDCHTSHYGVPPGTPSTTEPNTSLRPSTGPPYQLIRGQEPASKPSLRGTSDNLGAVSPNVCYRCHDDMRDLRQIANPHQICGPNGFNCTMCHDPHGRLREEGRKELCLECHQAGSPTMAWHSSTHDLYGVACTDCHNPHPRVCVPQVVNVSHTSIERRGRIPMAVDEPRACYKCHPKIFGLNALMSHHPIKEGKMVRSDCHDGHGQLEGNLKAETLNLLCWKCHADKQGPFVYEHPPVTENCGYCHEPHGTVANNLLRQPTTFLCLRCHSGHRRRHGFSDIDNNVDMQNAFYTDCTNCHTQIHGSDLPGPVRKQDFMR